MSEDATRAALSLSENEKGAALLLAATDAQVACAASEADRETALALSAHNTASAWQVVNYLIDYMLTSLSLSWQVFVRVEQ